jgi:AraC-like DNA-binding protein
MDNYLNTISPYIRIAQDSYINPPWKLKERVLFDYELLFIKSGKIKVTIEDDEFIGLPGELLLFKPLQRHSIEILDDEVFHQPHIHFDLHYSDDSPTTNISYLSLDEMKRDYNERYHKIKNNAFDVEIPSYLKLDNTEYCEKMLFEIINAYNTKLPFYEVEIKGLFIELWTYLIREVFWKNNPNISSNIKVLSKIKDYITLNVDRELSLDDIQQSFSMSKFHIIRLFRKTYGMTPIHFHQLTRVHKAKEMIQFTDMSITEIAENLGYSSVHSFSRAFKKIDGEKPTYFRR